MSHQSIKRRIARLLGGSAVGALALMPPLASGEASARPSGTAGGGDLQGGGTRTARGPGGPTPLTTLSIARVTKAIQRSILQQRHVGATVDCPTEVLQRKGVSFECQATVKPTPGWVGNRTYPFAVTEIDAKGNVRYVGR